MTGYQLIEYFKSLQPEELELEVMVLNDEMGDYWEVEGAEVVEDVVSPSTLKPRRRQKKERFLLIR